MSQDQFGKESYHGSIGRSEGCIWFKQRGEDGIRQGQEHKRKKVDISVS